MRALHGSQRLKSVSRVQGPDGELRIGLINQYADFNFRCRDRLDVDALVGQRPEHLRGNARVAPHANAHNRNLGHIGRMRKLEKANLVLDAAQHFDGLAQILARHREGDVGG